MFARDMMAMISARLIDIGEHVATKTAEGYKLKARWWYWDSKLSAAPETSMRCAKNLYAVSRDMLNRPEYYARKPTDLNFWQWFCLSANKVI